MRYAAAQPKPSARRARPGVASNPPQVHLCAFIARLQRGGELPQDAGAVTAANLALLDVGAAFGGELVVGGLLGFEVAAFEPHPAEWARLSGTWGARNRTKIVRRGRGTKKSTGESRLAALPDAGQRGRHTKPPKCHPFRGRGRVVGGGLGGAYAARSVFRHQRRLPRPGRRRWICSRFAAGSARPPWAR